MDRPGVGLAPGPLGCDVSPWVWLGLPLGGIALLLVMPAVGPERWWTWTVSERYGVVENGTAICLLAALVWQVRLLKRRRELPFGLLLLLTVLLLGTFYFAGEELSWGQHWLGFSSPEEVREVNKQGEFNLHNIPSLRFWLNATPRRLMMVGVIAGGLVAPLATLPWRRSLEARGRFWSLAVPTWRIVPASAVTVFWGNLSWLVRWLAPDLPPDAYLQMAVVRPMQEFRELGFAMVILIYVTSLWARLGSGGGPARGAGRAPAGPQGRGQGPVQGATPPAGVDTGGTDP